MYTCLTANSIHGYKGSHAYRRLQDTYKRKEPVPDLVARLSKEYNDKWPTPSWHVTWEDMQVPVEHVVAYWSRVLALVETCYSATEREAQVAKESLICFQPFIEGERIVTDHAALTWMKTYENANRWLAAWGLVFAAYPQLVIVHRPGRAHSNVNLLSRLPRLPNFISPAREDLPSPSISTKHEQLQEAWETFIQEHELTTEVKTVSAHPKTWAMAKTTDKSIQKMESQIPLIL
jgi:hypothetical protein